MEPNTTDNTPAHCHACDKLPTCHQAQHMVADTEPVQGFIADADLWCEECAPEGAEDTSYTSEETDVPQHCGGCGVPLKCTLTTDGVDYLKERLSERDAGCCRELWPVLFSDYLEE